MDALVQKLSHMKNTSTQKRYLKKKGYTEGKITEILNAVTLLQKGLKKFPRAAQMHYSNTSIAQASSMEIAQYRTWKLHSKLGKITLGIDLCAGIGGDAIAAGLRWNNLAIEKNPDVFDMFEHNIKVYKVQDKVRCILGDVNHLLLQQEFQNKINEANYVFFDPSRRSDKGRTVKIEEYIPPLNLIDQIMPLNPNMCVKIAPGVDILHIPYNCDIEIVSLHGEVKEAMLWFGKLKKNQDKRFIIATILPEKVILEKEITKYNENLPSLISSLRKYLYEPDSAVIKAHLINELAIQFDLHTIHKQVAYLTGNNYISTPWLKCYKILDSCPIDIPQIKSLLKKHGIHKVDCKARGISLDLHAIQKQLNTKGKNIGLVIFTWFDNQKMAIIAQYLWDFTNVK